MKKICLIPSFLVLISFSLFATTPGFMENRGQITDQNGNLRPDVLFTFFHQNVKVFIRKTGISYLFIQQEMQLTSGSPIVPKTEINPDQKTNTWRMDIDFPHANPDPLIRKSGKQEYLENYYLGHLAHPVIGAGCYDTITVENMFPGIDWVVFRTGDFFKYEFHVKAGADPSLVKMNVSGSSSIRILETGNLEMKTPVGVITEDKPEMVFARSESRSGNFRLTDTEISFEIPGYKTGEAVIIDPSLAWSTYMGGTQGEDAQGADIDPLGNIFITGYTNSSIGISSGGFQNVYGGGSDGFVSKYSSGGALLWSTYYGGSQYDTFYEIKAHSSTEIYVAGITSNTAGMTMNAHQSVYGGGSYDGLIFKLSGSGTLLWSTYYGGSDDDRTNGLATDLSGNLYVCGMSRSGSGIAFNGFQNSFSGNYDSYLVKFNPSGTRLWATYYGGTVTDAFLGLDTDRNGNVYTIGYTDNAPGLAFNGFQSSYGGGINDALIVKFDSNGGRMWASYYGGSGHDDGRDIHLDTLGNLYVTGYTASPNAMASGGHQNVFGGGYDVFLAKITVNGSFVWGSYYGGTGDDRGFSLDGDANGNIVCTGWVGSATGIAFNAFHQATSGGSTDAFLARFFSNGTIDFGTYFGGTQSDFGEEVSVGPSNEVVMAGSANSSNAISNNGFQNTYGGNGDCFLAKFALCPNQALPQISPSGTVNICPGDSVILTSTPSTNITWSTNATTASISVAQAGTYSVSVTNGGCTYTSLATTVNLLTAPTAPVISPAGPLGICTGASITLHSSVSGTNHWSSGGTADSLVVTAAGNYSAYVTSVNNCASPTSNSVNVIVFPVPATPQISPAGPVSICQGATTTLQSSSPSGNEWSTNQNTSSIMVANPGIYSVYVRDSHNCASASDSVQVIVNPLPMVSLVIGEDSFCTTDAAVVLSGGSPSGGTYSGNFVNAGSFAPGAAGVGSHTVYYSFTDPGTGCSAMDSQSVFVDVCLGIQEKPDFVFEVYPNPGAGIFRVNFSDTGNNTLKVYSISGALVIQREINVGESIDLRHLSSGIYNFQMENERRLIIFE